MTPRTHLHWCDRGARALSHTTWHTRRKWSHRQLRRPRLLRPARAIQQRRAVSHCIPHNCRPAAAAAAAEPPSAAVAVRCHIHLCQARALLPVAQRRQQGAQQQPCTVVCVSRDVVVVLVGALAAQLCAFGVRGAAPWGARARPTCGHVARVVPVVGVTGDADRDCRQAGGQRRDEPPRVAAAGAAKGRQPVQQPPADVAQARSRPRAVACAARGTAGCGDASAACGAR
jgi:hypothetical protein